jgi:hypothetical protein
VNRHGLDGALDRTAPADLEGADAGQHQPSVVKLPAGLAVREAVVAVVALEPWIAWLLSSVYTAEERLKCKVYALQHILQDLRAHELELKAVFFDAGQLPLLRVVAHPHTGHAVGLTALLQGSIVQLAAVVKHPL